MPPNRINLITMKANIIFKGLRIDGVEVSFIGSAIFTFSFPKEDNITIINFLTENGATVGFTSEKACATADRKDISFTLIG